MLLIIATLGKITKIKEYENGRIGDLRKSIDSSDYRLLTVLAIVRKTLKAMRI